MLAIYTRLSREDEESNSINNQLREGIEFAKNKPYKHYNEGEGVSGGAEIQNRPVLKQLIEHIYDDLITEVWFRQQDRLERNTSTFLLFTNAVKEKNINVYIGNNQQSIDYNDPNSFFQGGLMSLFNSYLIDKQSFLTKNAIKKNIELGYTHGIPPFGYKKESDENPVMVIDEEEAEIVKEIFQMSMDGIGYKAIANELNKRKIPTKLSKIKKKNYKWVHGTISKIIKNEIYTGVRKTRSGNVYEAPQIIEPYYFEKVNNNLKNNMTSSPKKVVHNYLLNDVCYCGVCGKDVHGRIFPKEGKIMKYYQCVTKRLGKDSCGNQQVRMPVLEYIIWDLYFLQKKILNLKTENTFDSDYNGTLESSIYYNQAIIDIKLEIEKLKIKKSKIIDFVVDGVLSKSDVKEKLFEVNKEIDDNEVQLKELKIKQEISDRNLNQFHLIDDEINEIDPNADFTTKKEIINKFIEDIKVTKLPKKDIEILVSFKNPNYKMDYIQIDRLYKNYLQERENIITELN